MTLLKLHVIIVCILLLVSSSCYDKKPPTKILIPEPKITWMMEGDIKNAVLWINEDEFIKLQAYIQATQDLQLDRRKLCQNLEKLQ